MQKKRKFHFKSFEKRPKNVVKTFLFVIKRKSISVKTKAAVYEYLKYWILVKLGQGHLKYNNKHGEMGRLTHVTEILSSR